MIGVWIEDISFVINLTPVSLKISPCVSTVSVTTRRTPFHFVTFTILEALLVIGSASNPPSQSCKTTTHLTQVHILLVSAHPTITTCKPHNLRHLPAFQVPPSEPEESLQVPRPETIIYVLVTLPKPLNVVKLF